MTYRLAALKQAATHLGVHEQPPHSNRGPLIDKWNRDAGAPIGSYWCCSFVHCMFKAVGFDLWGGASVQQVRQGAKQRGLIVKRPFRGDLACFDFNEGDRYGPFGDHIGFVARVLALRWTDGRFTGWITTLEANTSKQNDLTGSQSNGGGVYRRRRWLRGISAEFVRVPGTPA